MNRSALRIPRLFGFPVLACLLLMGAGPGCQSTSDSTATLGAAGNNAAPADLEVRDAEGYTPLHRAVLDNDVQKAKALLQAGADPDARIEGRSDGFTPLHTASLVWQNPEMARALLEAGASVNAAALGGDTPLRVARQTTFQNVDGELQDKSAFIDLLIKHGAKSAGASVPPASKNADFTDLHRAVMDNDLQKAKDLLKAGADPNARVGGKPYGLTALHLVVMVTQNAAMAEELINAGASVNAGAMGGTTPLKMALGISVEDKGKSVDMQPLLELLRVKGAK